MNNLPKVVTQQRRGRASNPRLLDRKSDALPLSHRATLIGPLICGLIAAKGLTDVMQIYSSVLQM